MVFDFDGTMCRLFKNFDLKSTVSEIRRRMGVYGFDFPSNKDAFEIFDFISSRNSLSEERKKELYVEMNAVLTAAELEGVKSCEPVSGVGEVLPYLKQAGYKVGVATNNSPECVKEFLKIYCGGLDIPIVGRVGSQPQLMKPNKWSLTEVLKIMDCEVGDAVFFGDTQRDYECSLNAACKFVGIAPTEKKLQRLSAAAPEIDIFTDFYGLKQFV